MKKYFIVMAAFLFVTVTGRSQAKKFRDLVGRWEIAGEQESGASLRIIDSATILLTYGGEKKKIADGRFDFSKSPAWFDFSITDTLTSIKVKSLLQFLGDDMIKWQLFTDEDRPAHFSASTGELFYLKKSKAPVVAAVVRE